MSVGVGGFEVDDCKPVAVDPERRFAPSDQVLLSSTPAQPRRGAKGLDPKTPLLGLVMLGADLEEQAGACRSVVPRLGGHDRVRPVRFAPL